VEEEEDPFICTRKKGLGRRGVVGRGWVAGRAVWGIFLGDKGRLIWSRGDSFRRSWTILWPLANRLVFINILVRIGGCFLHARTWSKLCWSPTISYA